LHREKAFAINAQLKRETITIIIIKKKTNKKKLVY
jgi:hypothetical protein